MGAFQEMGVQAVIDGYRNYINGVGKMASATERSHSRIGRLGQLGFKGLITGAGVAAASVVAIGAAAGAASIALGGLAVKMAIDAAPLVDLELGFNAIAENAGQVGAVVLSTMKTITAGTIRAADLMQLYNKGTTLLGENFNSIIPIMDQIIAQGAAIGLEPLQAVEDFTTGVARESKMILDNLGIIVNISDATESYAETLGKTADELSAVERQAAILSAAQTSLEKTSKALPSLNEFATTSLAQFKTMMQETRDEIGKALVPALKEFVGLMTAQIGPEAEIIVDIFKDDFLPTIQKVAKFLGANLPKLLKFAVSAFRFFGRVVQGVWRFFETFLIPTFNYLYRVFVDRVIPILEKAWKFFESLGLGIIGIIGPSETLRDRLLSLIPQPVLDAIENLKTKWGEWKAVAATWWEETKPKLIEAFNAVKDYIVNDFIPNALVFLTTEFDPVIDAAGRLWDALLEKKPDVIAAWNEFKREAEATFAVSIPAALAHLESIWNSLITLITGDIDDMTSKWDEHGGSVIETIGDIATLIKDVLNIALLGTLQLLDLIGIGLVALRTGDWDRFSKAMSDAAEASRELIHGFGIDIMDLLNIPVTAAQAGTFHEGAAQNISPLFHDTSAAPPVTAPSGAGGLHGEANTQNFSLTVQTSAPIEPVIADFRMLAALARGPIR